MSDTETPDLTQLTVQLLSSYFSNNTVPASDIASIIQTTRTALGGETAPAAPAEPEHVPAVSVRKSLGSRDHIISMIDGKAYKMLKRHLATHGLTPAEYRERYKLPPTYPMVSPNYAEQRRTVAAKIGLGRKKPEAETESTPAPAQTPASATAKTVATKTTKAPSKAANAKKAAPQIKRAVGRPAKAPPQAEASPAPGAADASTLAKAPAKRASAKKAAPSGKSTAAREAGQKTVAKTAESSGSGATASKAVEPKSATRPKRSKAEVSGPTEAE